MTLATLRIEAPDARCIDDILQRLAVSPLALRLQGRTGADDDVPVHIAHLLLHAHGILDRFPATDHGRLYLDVWSRERAAFEALLAYLRKFPLPLHVHHCTPHGFDGLLHCSATYSRDSAPTGRTA